ncbi:MAG: hypothetical protein HOP15_09320 [Planctomycetes bacterium]|nr:hypothetical protein [Planctomycetota bacterium]
MEICARSFLIRLLPLAAGIAGVPLAAQTAQSVTPAGSVRALDERVAYVSDEAVNDVFELYGAPIDGSAAAVRLNLPLPAGGDVIFSSSGPFSGGAQFDQVAGDRVLYIADQLANDVFELFSVPNFGRAPPVRLNGPLVAGGDVSAFLAGRKRVVYRADETIDNRYELYSVPLDGSAPSRSLTPGLNVHKLAALSRDGSKAVFTVFFFGKELLYVVPTGGGQPRSSWATRVSPRASKPTS